MGNPITNELPQSLDNFLQDMCQMYCDMNYTDVSKFAKRATSDDITALRKLYRKFRKAAEYDDEDEIAELTVSVEDLVKGKGLTESFEEGKNQELKVGDIVNIKEFRKFDRQAKITEIGKIRGGYFAGRPFVSAYQSWGKDHAPGSTSGHNFCFMRSSGEWIDLKNDTLLDSKYWSYLDNLFGYNKITESEDEEDPFASEKEGNPYIVGNCSLCGANGTDTVENLLKKNGFEDIEYCCDVLDIDPLEEVCEECFNSWLPDLNKAVYSEYDDLGTDTRTGSPLENHSMKAQRNLKRL